MADDHSLDVLLVDDHPLIRLGITHLLQESSLALRVHASAAQQDATTILRERQFSLAIVDISLPDGSGLELIHHQQAHHPQTKWLVLSVFSEPFHQMRAREAGADGFLSKRAIESELLKAVEQLLGGGEYPLGFRSLTRAAMDNGLSVLSEREMTVFRLISEGMTIEQIASSLSRSRKTINALRDRIRSKLGVTSSAELARYATQWYLSQAEQSIEPPAFQRKKDSQVGRDQSSPD